jgi:hypothetical protein
MAWDLWRSWRRDYQIARLAPQALCLASARPKGHATGSEDGGMLPPRPPASIWKKSKRICSFQKYSRRRLPNAGQDKPLIAFPYAHAANREAKRALPAPAT